MSTEAKQTHYELPTGAVAILDEVLGTAQWYKDDPKQTKTVISAFGAIQALPDTAARPMPEKDERPDAYSARVDAWAAMDMEFEWTDKEKDAAKRCVAYYLKQGAFTINANIVALLTLLGLDDE